MIFFDIQFNHFLYNLRTETFVNFFSIVTWLGKWWIVFFLAFIISIIFWKRKEKFNALALWSALAAANATAFLGKTICRRPRPELAVYNEHSFSFPSAHAINAVVFYGFLLYIFWQKSKNLKQKILSTLAGLSIMFIIGFSRLYLGVHYLSDVLAGYLIGAIWLIATINIKQRVKNKGGGNGERKNGERKRIYK